MHVVVRPRSRSRSRDHDTVIGAGPRRGGGGEGEGLSGRGRLWGVIWVSAVLQRCRVPVLPLMLSCIRVQVRDLAIMTLSLERKERRGRGRLLGSIW